MLLAVHLREVLILLACHQVVHLWWLRLPDVHSCVPGLHLLRLLLLRLVHADRN